MYDFANCKRCRKIARLYPDLEPDEVFNETFIRIVEKYGRTTLHDPVSMFFMVSRSAAKSLRKTSQPPIEHTTRLAIEWEHHEPTPYQKALDSYLAKNDDTYSQVVEMYLLCPNLSKLSRDTGIKKHHLKEILDNGITRIGFEYLRNKTHD